jgi:hypothetical protein
MAKRIHIADDGDLPRVPRELYDLLNPLGKPRRYGSCPEWSRWAARLWIEHKTRPKTVAQADADFQRYHNDNCAGCHYGLGEAGPVLIPGEHEDR